MSSIKGSSRSLVDDESETRDEDQNEQVARGQSLDDIIRRHERLLPLLKNLLYKHDDATASVKTYFDDILRRLHPWKQFDPSFRRAFHDLISTLKKKKMLVDFVRKVEEHQEILFGTTLKNETFFFKLRTGGKSREIVVYRTRECLGWKWPRLRGGKASVRDALIALFDGQHVVLKVGNLRLKAILRCVEKRDADRRITTCKSLSRHNNFVLSRIRNATSIDGGDGGVTHSFDATSSGLCPIVTLDFEEKSSVTPLLDEILYEGCCIGVFTRVGVDESFKSHSRKLLADTREIIPNVKFEPFLPDQKTMVSSADVFNFFAKAAKALNDVDDEQKRNCKRKRNQKKRCDDGDDGDDGDGDDDDDDGGDDNRRKKNPAKRQMTNNLKELISDKNRLEDVVSSAYRKVVESKSRSLSRETNRKAGKLLSSTTMVSTVSNIARKDDVSLLDILDAYQSEKGQWSNAVESSTVAIARSMLQTESVVNDICERNWENVRLASQKAAMDATQKTMLFWKRLPSSRKDRRRLFEELRKMENVASDRSIEVELRLNVMADEFERAVQLLQSRFSPLNKDVSVVEIFDDKTRLIHRMKSGDMQNSTTTRERKEVIGSDYFEAFGKDVKVAKSRETSLPMTTTADDQESAVRVRVRRRERVSAKVDDAFRIDLTKVTENELVSYELEIEVVNAGKVTLSACQKIVDFIDLVTLTDCDAAHQPADAILIETQELMHVFYTLSMMNNARRKVRDDSIYNNPSSVQGFDDMKPSSWTLRTIRQRDSQETEENAKHVRFLDVFRSMFEIDMPCEYETTWASKFERDLNDVDEEKRKAVCEYVENAAVDDDADGDVEIWVKSRIFDDVELSRDESVFGYPRRVSVILRKAAMLRACGDSWSAKRMSWQVQENFDKIYTQALEEQVRRGRVRRALERQMIAFSPLYINDVVAAIQKTLREDFALELQTDEVLSTDSVLERVSKLFSKMDEKLRDADRSKYVDFCVEMLRQHISIVKTLAESIPSFELDDNQKEISRDLQTAIARLSTTRTLVMRDADVAKLLKSAVLALGCNSAVSADEKVAIMLREISSFARNVADNPDATIDFTATGAPEHLVELKKYFEQFKKPMYASWHDAEKRSAIKITEVGMTKNYSKSPVIIFRGPVTNLLTGDAEANTPEILVPTGNDVSHLRKTNPNKTFVTELYLGTVATGFSAIRTAQTFEELTSESSLYGILHDVMKHPDVDVRKNTSILVQEREKKDLMRKFKARVQDLLRLNATPANRTRGMRLQQEIGSIGLTILNKFGSNDKIRKVLDSLKQAFSFTTPSSLVDK
jgi:hypothetical protein